MPTKCGYCKYVFEKLKKYLVFLMGLDALENEDSFGVWYLPLADKTTEMPDVNCD